MPVSASVRALRMTYFQAQKLHSVNGDRALSQCQSAPYRITTFNGPDLGLIGYLPAVLYKLHEINASSAANREDTPESAPSLLQKIKRYCLKR